MNKRKRKKQFKKIYGMNPKQYQQVMQLTSLEEPLKKLWIRKQLHLQIWGVALKELKMDCKNQFLL
nr:MAG TPA: Toxin co-regulated pilus virulence regulatory, XylS, virulence regulation, cholerae [Bacteriophage sp.]